MRVQQKPFYADLFSKTSAATVPAPPPEPNKTTVPAVSAHPPPALPPAPPPEPNKTALPAPPKTALPAPPKTALPALPKTALPALPAPLDRARENTDGAAAGAPAAVKRQALFDVIGVVDIHNMSPRQMTGLGQDLYAAGAISFEDYSLLAFQPELHPDFDRTIGALTGERAAPDRRRDYLGLWSERAEFERRHNPGRPDLIEQSERIASVLRRIESPTDLTV